MNIDLPDTDGRTPLHWAAYKGYSDTIRLLLVLDARCEAVWGRGRKLCGVPIGCRQGEERQGTATTASCYVGATAML